MEIKVTSEIGKLKKVLIHSPDGGIGNVPTNKLHDWLYDDIVDVEKIQDEYAKFQALLILFLETNLLFDNEGKFLLDIDNNFKSKKNLNGDKLFQSNPEKNGYFISEDKCAISAVLDTQYLLQYIFKHFPEKAKVLIERICAIEGIHSYRTKDIISLIDNETLSDGKNGYIEAVKTLLTGKLEYQLKGNEIIKLEGDDARYIFPPVPNFIFTRDIGVTIGNHLLITKPKFYIRKREVILFRFIAENFIFNEDEHYKIINVSENDDFFQIEEKDQPQNKVNYEGGDIMMISKRHVLIGCSERTSQYAIQKLVYRLFWEDIKTGEDSEIDIISVIKISENRSQMHIDTILSHVKENLWIIHSPLSEVWQEEQEMKEWRTTNYIDSLTQKSENEIEKNKDVTIFQFYLNENGKKLKKKYEVKGLSLEQKKKIKSKFNKASFLLKPIKGDSKYENPCTSPYTENPKGLQDLLANISVLEFGINNKKDVKFVWSGGGEIPFDTREQWTDACNLLILRSGIAVGYDRNYKTAIEFNNKMKGEKETTDKKFKDYLVSKNKQRFKFDNLSSILHIDDLLYYIGANELNLSSTIELINSIENTLILLPSNELSRARGGSHCMSMPLLREKP